MTDGLMAMISHRKNHCRNCGRYVGDDLCQCRIRSIVRCAKQAQQVQELMVQHRRDLQRRQVAEVACLAD